jgi:hypothetical protein
LVDALYILRLKVGLMRRCLLILEEFKITNIKVANYAEIHPLKIVIAGLNQNFFTGL